MEKFQRVPVFVLVVLSLAGCDPGEQLLKPCEDAMATLPSQDDGTAPEPPGDWERARAACEKLAKANSKLASKGSALVAEIDAREGALKKAIADRIEAERKAAEAAKAEALKKEIDSCKSKQWVSACESNGVPQGGAFYSDSPQECEKSAQDFRQTFGLKCVKCGCSDEMVKVLSGRVY